MLANGPADYQNPSQNDVSHWLSDCFTVHILDPSGFYMDLMGERVKMVVVEWLSY